MVVVVVVVVGGRVVMVVGGRVVVVVGSTDVVVVGAVVVVVVVVVVVGGGGVVVVGCIASDVAGLEEGKLDGQAPTGTQAENTGEKLKCTTAHAHANIVFLPFTSTKYVQKILCRSSFL